MRIHKKWKELADPHPARRRRAQDEGVSWAKERQTVSSEREGEAGKAGSRLLRT